MGAAGVASAKPRMSDDGEPEQTDEEAKEEAEEKVLALADLLLDAGDTEVDAMDKVGRTPLHIACGNTHEELIMALLDKGASLNAKQRDGKTPIMVAEEVGDHAILQ